MRVLGRSDLTARPWKNGGGLTWEIASFPEGADFDTMAWRLSMAEVATAGPFSRFDGIDRTLMLVSGGGMALDFAQGGSVTLAAGAALSFPGEADLNARLLAGPVLDFNVMTRRGVLRHWLVALEAGSPAPPGSIALLARGQSVRTAGLALAPGMVLLANAGEDLCGCSGDGPLMAVVLQRTQ